MTVQTRKPNALWLGYQLFLSSHNRKGNMNKQLRKVKRKQCAGSPFEAKEVTSHTQPDKGKKLNPLNKAANK